MWFQLNSLLLSIGDPRALAAHKTHNQQYALLIKKETMLLECPA
jgi:hypothetical protein